MATDKPKQQPFLGHGAIPASVCIWQTQLLPPASQLEGPLLKPVVGDPSFWLISTTRAPRRRQSVARNVSPAKSPSARPLRIPGARKGKKTASPHNGIGIDADGAQSENGSTVSLESSTAVDTDLLVAEIMESSLQQSPNRHLDDDGGDDLDVSASPRSPAAASDLTVPPHDEKRDVSPLLSRMQSERRRDSRATAGLSAKDTDGEDKLRSLVASMIQSQGYDRSKDTSLTRLHKALAASRDPTLLPPPLSKRALSSSTLMSPPRRVTPWETRIRTVDQQLGVRRARVQQQRRLDEKEAKKHVLENAMRDYVRGDSTVQRKRQLPTAAAVGQLLSKAAIGHF
jgi:hypothetical protein